MSELKPVIKGFESARLNYGDFISHRDIDHWAELTYPQISVINNQAELQDAMQGYSLKRLTAIEALKDYALRQRKMLLVPVRGEGYRIAQPNEQTDLVAVRGMREIRKGLKTIERGIEHVEVSRLSHAEREYRSSVQSRLAGLRLMVGRRTTLLPSKS